MSAEYIKAVAELISAIAWPILCLIVVLMYRQSINHLMRRAKRLTLPGGFEYESELREALDKEADALTEADPEAARKVTTDQFEAAERISRMIPDDGAAAARQSMFN